ncbi:unnamed protein product, partial [Mesorhabditis belari]|uniref:BHLH domain-containing protein n=1 Tax=Mesorhabditis belari TaxID=2138241 RepID=A0AAF3J1T7_9BILA
MGSHEPIHSGHFMTSNPHTDPTPEEEDDNEVDVESLEVDDEKTQEMGRAKAELYADKPVTFYKFGPKKTQSIAIDVSLNKLNKCIKVAYNKMTTPKWKDFKGLRLHWKQRIRLNNVIWRAYYMEFRRPQDFIAKKLLEKKKYCYFSVPDDDNTHAKIEGTLIEGMYWKRRMAAVSAQYKRWRHFFKNRRPGAKRKRERSGPLPAIMKVSAGPVQRSQTPLAQSDWDADEFENIFTDELFASLNQPYMFPNPREMMQTGYADIVQPGLLSLQPSLEEIMCTLDGSELTAPNTNGGSAPPSSLSLDRSGDLRSQLLERQETVPDHMQFNQFVVPAPPMTRDESSLGGDYSIKDYANMLVDYSNQPVAQQPTRLPSQITSQMLIMSGSISAQPQYSQLSAAQYSPRMPWKNVPSPQPSNCFLVTGGDVAQVDYSSPFIGHIGPSRLNQPAPTPAQSMGGMPWSRSTPSSTASWLEQQLASPASLQVLTPSPSPSLQSPSVLSPLSMPCPSSLGIQSELPPATTHMNDLLRSSPSRQSHQNFHNLSQRSDLRQLMLRPESEATKPSLLVSPITQSGLNNGPRSHQIPKQETPPSPQTYLSLKPKLSVPSNWQVPSPSLSDGPRVLSRSHNDEKNWNQMMQAPGSIESNQSNEMLEPKHDIEMPKERTKSNKMEPADSTLNPSERKRILHLHAEQNRRCALKDGFDQLTELIPDLYSGGVKPTNAVVLAKAAEYIKGLNTQKETTAQRKSVLQNRIETLNAKIALLQTSLPSASASTGSASVDSTTQLMQFVERYTRERSREQFNFWLLVKLLEPMLHSFASRLHQDPGDRNEISHTAALWFCEEWKVQKLRPLASNLLVYLATNTSILTDPTALENHVREKTHHP